MISIMLNKKQYEDSSRFDARVYLNAKFKTNPHSWSRWIFDQLPQRQGMKILELGCGTGLVWLANRDRIPASWDISLSDYSEGMLEKTQHNLSRLTRNFSYHVVHAEHIGFEDDRFDVVMANLMLYHVENRARALLEIRRIMKKDGLFATTTYGDDNMLELNVIFHRFLEGMGKSPVRRKNPFSLENGREQLSHVFGNIELRRYENALEVNEIDPIVNYFLSLNDMFDDTVMLGENDAEAFREYLKKIFNERKSIRVTKDTGMFLCTP